MSLRIFLVHLCALAVATLAHAQPAATPPKPPDVAPPPIPAYSGDAELEPQVTITRRGTDTVEEVRVNGELRHLKVTPKIGPPYYLVPSGNGQTYLRYDSLDFGLKTPMWLLFSW